MGGPTLVRFHGFVLDAGRRIVSRSGRRVHFTRKAFDLGPDRWVVGDGPAIRLVQARDNTTQALVIRITSLSARKRA